MARPEGPDTSPAPGRHPMKKLLFTLTLAALLPLPMLAQDGEATTEAAKEEMKKLEGTWNIVSMEMGGQPVPLDKAGFAQLVFKGDRMSFGREGKAVKTFGFRLDPAKKPKAMDWIYLDEKGLNPLPAIYALDGDELRLCFPLLPKKGEGAGVVIRRPEGFVTKDLPVGLFVAKRDKS
jgi:uncharacterized protein (TIGR03067 family)